MKKQWPWVLLGVLACGLGLVLAIYHLQTQLVFGFDQARDAFTAYAIWHGFHLKILGPSTDIPGVFHGVLWYYYLAVVYFLGREPYRAVLVSLVIFFSSVFLVGLVAKRLFNDRRVTFLAVAFYALSPLFQVFTRWLSNPSLGLLVAPCLLLFLWSYFSKPKLSAAFFSGIFFGLLIQADFAHGLLLLTLPVYWWYFRPRLIWKDLGLFVLGVGLTTASFLVADLKFGGQTTLGMLHFFTKGSANPAIGDAFLVLVNRFFELLVMTVLPWPKLVGLIFLVILFFRLKKSLPSKDYKPVVFLAIWVFGFVIIQIISSAVAGSAHIFVSFLLPTVVLFALFLIRAQLLWVVPIIFVTQITTIFSWTGACYSPLSVQRGIFYSEEVKIIDYTYQEAAGQPFIINSVTNPLFINTLWAYLYQFYGQAKYGYVPFWGGRDQAGYLGNLPQKPFGENARFLIIEDPSGIPDFYLAKAIYEEDKVSDVVEEKSFGKMRVQKRIFHPNKGPVPMPEIMLKATPDLLQ